MNNNSNESTNMKFAKTGDTETFHNPFKFFKHREKKIVVLLDQNQTLLEQHVIQLLLNRISLFGRERWVGQALSQHNHFCLLGVILLIDFTC